MIVAVVLAGYALAIAFGTPVLLRRAGWSQRAPRLGIAVWLSACASVVLALVLAGLALAVPTVPVSDGLSQWLQACVMALRDAYATPSGVILATAGTAVTFFVAVRVLFAMVSSWVGASRHRSAHCRAVELAGRRRLDLDALVVDCDQAAAYCVPGRHRQVVLTTAALAALSPAELSAVLAHEQAHLRGRHHLLVGAVEGFAAAFPGVPLFQEARTEVATLTEMVADDVAARAHPRSTIAAAVVALAAMRTPPAALAASGSAALSRVRRLAAPTNPLPAAAMFSFGLLALAILALPISVAAAPALHAMHMHLCPVPAPTVRM